METYELIRKLGMLSNKVDNLYAQYAKSQSINYNTLAVLYVAYMNKEFTQTQVCDMWVRHKQTIHTVCKELERKGYIAMQKGEADRREMTMRLTESGRKYAAPIVERLILIETEVFKKMGEASCLAMIKENKAFCDFLQEEIEKYGGTA